MISLCWEMSLKLGQFPEWEESDGGSLLFSHISCLVCILWLLMVLEHLAVLRMDGNCHDSFSGQDAPGQVPSGCANGFLVIITFGVL